MEVPRYDVDGTERDPVELPAVFETPYRPDLIERAVAVARANAAQPHGADPYAGKRTSAESFGAGRGVAMVPRSNNRGRRVPQVVGGRRAHPPKAEADRSKQLNDKERRLAVASAIAATADADRVRGRGHRLPADLPCPVVVDDAFEGLTKTSQTLAFLEAIGLDADIDRADSGRTRRGGRGTTRGRAARTPASILFVTSSEAGPSRAARNLAGATVATGREVDVTELAPGGHPGRLTVYTDAALEEVADR
ncbi:MAG: 50S ribosomal protein L4 [Halobacteriales archaeon]